MHHNMQLFQMKLKYLQLIIQKLIIIFLMIKSIYLFIMIIH